MDSRYKFTCRVCLVKDSSSFMRSLADQQTRKLLFDCTSVVVRKGKRGFLRRLCLSSSQLSSFLFPIRSLLATSIHNSFATSAGISARVIPSSRPWLDNDWQVWTERNRTGKWWTTLREMRWSLSRERMNRMGREKHQRETYHQQWKINGDIVLGPAPTTQANWNGMDLFVHHAIKNW